ncbi:MAG TPA: ABC transporter permease [Planctomycetota bacterium]|nr:ABC transporter permease [Planctomycetota bacterium]
MTLIKTGSLAVEALRRNVGRSALTVLGIVIGIAAVIAMMEIGKGSSTSIAATIASMGANNLLVMPGTASSGGVSFGAGSILTLTSEDCEAILRECPAVEAASPIVRARTQIIYGNENWVPQYIYGITPAYLDVRDWTRMADGDALGAAEIRNVSRVCMVGQTIVHQLFHDQSPIGREIRIQSENFKVMGVLSAKGANAFGMDQDDIVLAPWTTIKYRIVGGSGSGAAAGGNAAAASTSNSVFPGALSVSLFPIPSASQLADQPTPVRFANVDQILLAARSAQAIPTALSQVTELLRERHRIRPGQNDDFAIRDMTESANALASTTNLMTKLLLAVALISLVVGGVGIMNIMLVSVTERTREIGLRMAVGATPGDVLRQFLAEALLLCVIGGLVGLALGRGTSLLVREFLHWPVEASLEAVVAAIVVSAAVGVGFGFYPAWKASMLDPIDALRYE